MIVHMRCKAEVCKQFQISTLIDIAMSLALGRAKTYPHAESRTTAFSVGSTGAHALRKQLVQKESTMRS